MTDLKQYKKQRKKLKHEIKATKAHLKRLKQELNQLRENQQHQVIDEDVGELLEQSSRGTPSLIKRLVQLFKG